MAGLVLIRHGEAGNRGDWPDDDRLRPLTSVGLGQAEGLIRLLDAIPFDRIRSSPYVRCRQTVEPLARARSLPVVDDEALAEGGSLNGLLEAVALASGGWWAACTHGDLLHQLLRLLADSGKVGKEETGDAKGGSWVLEVAPSGITSARYLPPPAGQRLPPG